MSVHPSLCLARVFGWKKTKESKKSTPKPYKDTAISPPKWLDRELHSNMFPKHNEHSGFKFEFKA